MLQPENELQTYKRSLVRAGEVTKSGNFSGATPLRRDPSPGLNGAFSKKVPLLSTGFKIIKIDFFVSRTFNYFFQFYSGNAY